MAEKKKKKVTIVAKKPQSKAAQPASAAQEAGAAAGKKRKAKKKGGLLDLPSLLDFPAGVADTAREVWMAGIGALSSVEEMGQEMFDGLVKKGEKWEQESRKRLTSAASGAAKAASGAAEGARTTAGGLGLSPGEWSERVEQQVQRVVEDAVEGVLHRIGVPTHEEVRDLIRRVDALSGKVDALSARMKLQQTKKEKPPVKSATPPAVAGSTVYLVLPGESGWVVQREGNTRATSAHPTKAEAVRAGRDLARDHAPSRLVVHKQDGSVQDEFTYGD